MNTTWIISATLVALIGFSAGVAEAGSLTYTYDDAGRLTQAGGTPGTRIYQLDAAGNRTGLTLQVGLGGASPQSLSAAADKATASEGIPAGPPLVGAPSHSGTP